MLKNFSCTQNATSSLGNFGAGAFRLISGSDGREAKAMKVAQRTSEVITNLLLAALLFALTSEGKGQPSLLSRAGLKNLVTETLQQAMRHHLQHKEIYGSEEFWSFGQLAVGLAEAGCFSEAVQVLKAMPKPTKEFSKQRYWDIYRQVAMVAAKSGRHDLAVRLTKQIPNYMTRYHKRIEPTGDMQKASAVRVIAQSLEKLPPAQRQKRFEEALFTALQIGDNFWRGDSLCELAIAAHKFSPQEVKRLAGQVLAIAEKCVKDSERMKLIAKIAAVVSRWDKQKATELFNRALTIALRQPQKHYERDFAVWFVVEKMIEAEFWDEAIKTAQLLPEVEPKVSDIPALAPMVILPPTKWRALATIAKALAERGQVDRALQIVETIKPPLVRIETLVSVAQLLAKSSPQKAEELLWKAMTETSQNVSTAHSFFVAIVEVASKVVPQKVSEFAFRTVKPLRRLSGYSAAITLSGIATKLSGVDRNASKALFSEALKVARRISDHKQRMLALETLADQMSQANFFNDAAALLPEIEQASQARGNVSPGRWCLTARRIVEAMTKAGRINQAVLLLQKMNQCRSEDRFEALLAIGEALAPRDRKRAEEFIRKAWQMVKAEWQEEERRAQELRKIGSRIYPSLQFHRFLKITLSVARVVSAQTSGR